MGLNRRALGRHAVLPALGDYLLFTAALALVTGVIFGLAPALEASRTDVAKSIKDETVPAGAGRRFSLRKALVMAQVALSVLS
ncbi:MAG: hypothetical protein B7X11_03260, partial [Acidobacteria bacterium 37-65-4]